MGNRKQLNSTVPAIPTGVQSYDANDRLSTDNYDPAGNTVSSGGIVNAYDFENHLVQHGAVTVVYDGDGNRVAKTAGGVTTKYLVSDINPTGYAQVMDELQAGAVVRHYSYGLEMISETQKIAGVFQTSFYSYDGHGSVRQLTNPAGTVTDTYTYDAFGNLLEQTGTTPNLYLYAGQQFDPDLGLYYNRARYLDVRNGRFSTADTFEGSPNDPRSLHAYLYAVADPVNLLDPNGHDSLDELMTSAAVDLTITALSNVLVTGIFFGSTGSNPSFDGAIASVHGNWSGNGWTVEGGIDFLWQKSTNQFFYSVTGGGGTNPLGTLPTSKAGRGPGYSLTIGPIFNMSDPQQMSGGSVSAVYPMSILRLIQGAMLTPNKAWGALSELAYHVKNAGISDMTAAFGFSAGGPTFAQFGLRSNAFGTFGFYSSKFYPLSGSGFESMVHDASSGLERVFSLMSSGVFGSSNSMSANADEIVQAVRTASQP